MLHIKVAAVIKISNKNKRTSFRNRAFNYFSALQIEIWRVKPRLHRFIIKIQYPTKRIIDCKARTPTNHWREWKYNLKVKELIKKLERNFCC